MKRAAIAISVLLAASTMAATTHRAPVRAPLDDATIFAILDNANAAEIESGNLAKDRARTKEVRDFAAMLVQAHTDARSQGKDLATKLGVTPTDPKPDPDTTAFKDQMARLRSSPPAEFDRAFLDQQVALHTAVLAALKNTIVPQIKNEELKTLVNGMIPTIEQHRQGAQDLLKKLPTIPQH
jgi:putative membrane protein